MSPRILIVFYSLSGNTEGLARDLAGALPADAWEFEALHERRPRTGWRGMLRCVRDALGRRKPALVTPRFRPRDYDVVLVGTPVWVGRLSAPVRTYLASEEFGTAKLGVFVTSGGPLNAATWRDIQDACPKPPAAVLHFRMREVHDVVRIDGFLQATGVTARVDVPARDTARPEPVAS